MMTLKKSKNEQGRSKTCVRAVKWIGWLIFSGITIFWISKVLEKYLSYPVSTAVTLVKNETFTMPSITICPLTNIFGFVPCLNETKLEMYNISDFRPGKFTRYYEILSQVKYDKKGDALAQLSCHYSIKQYRDEGILDCKNDTNILGSWKTYQTQETTCHTFTPIPAVGVNNYVNIILKHDPCRYFQIAIHDPSEVYELETSFDFKTRYLFSGDSYQIHAMATEFHKVNRKPSPCVEDPGYSQSACLNVMKMKYLIKLVGCNIPDVTGFQIFEDYPRCTHMSAVDRFVYERHLVSFEKDSKYRSEMKKDVNKCLESCHKLLYKVNMAQSTKKSVTDYYKRSKSSSITLRPSKDAIPFMRVKEHLDLTPDMLVSFIGGTIGIFLGFSCLSLLDFVEILLEKIISFIKQQ